MKCTLCGEKITKCNNGFSELLDNEEKQKVLQLKHDETICTECKFDLMMLDIISPFR